MRWIKSNYLVIKESFPLSILGLFLSLAHIITAFLWFLDEVMQLGSFRCWDFWPFCQLGQEILFQSLPYLLKIYGGLGCMAALCFLWRRAIRFGWWFLLASFLMRTMLYLSYADLADNVYSFLLVLDFCFLFIPEKERVIKALTISSYLVLGVLKLNTTYLTGLWLHPWLGDMSFKTMGVVGSHYSRC